MQILVGRFTFFIGWIVIVRAHAIAGTRRETKGEEKESGQKE